MTTALISPEVDRAAWLKERRRGIGASEAPVVLGLTGSRLRLYLSKLDEIEPEPQTDRQRIGLKLEPVIASEYEHRTGRKIRWTQRFLRHPDYDWVLATLDGITECGRVVEFKSCDVFGPEGRRLGPDGDSASVPDKWRVQINQQLALARATGEADGDEGDVAAWINNELRIYPCRRSESLWQVTADTIEEFWMDHVIAGVPPEELAPGDSSLLTLMFRRQSGEVLGLDDEAGRWARGYHELGRRIGELQDERDVLKARMLLALGNADGFEAPGGVRVDRRVITVNRKAQDARTDEQVRLTVKLPDTRGEP